ncbi:hypothetical protein [uncultured Dubosiella sp.]|uniref:hypothetical protein n=1 Tax=uncultured Dubosiella sp. TaxID=1937011 RepID=UPI002731B916|nr:hypothetical protein [uncultured Dubosiella sp.]
MAVFSLKVAETHWAREKGMEKDVPVKNYRIKNHSFYPVDSPSISAHDPYEVVASCGIAEIELTLDLWSKSGLKKTGMDTEQERIADAKHPGGLNLFGRQFGDYDQDIQVRFLRKE